MKQAQSELLIQIFQRMNGDHVLNGDISKNVGSVSAITCGVNVGHPFGIKSRHIKQEAEKAELTQQLTGQYSATTIARFLESHHSLPANANYAHLVNLHFPTPADAAAEQPGLLVEIIRAIATDMAPGEEHQLSRKQKVKVSIGSVVPLLPLIFFSIDGVKQIANKAGTKDDTAKTLGLVIGIIAGVVAIASQAPFIYKGLNEQELRFKKPFQTELLSDVERSRLQQFADLIRRIFSIESAIGAAMYMDSLIVTAGEFLFHSPKYHLSDLYLIVEQNDTSTNLDPLTQFVCLNIIKLVMMSASLFFSTINNDDHVRHTDSLVRYFFPSKLDRLNHWMCQFTLNQKQELQVAVLNTCDFNSTQALQNVYSEVEKIKNADGSGIQDRSRKQRFWLALSAAAMALAAKTQYWNVGLQQLVWFSKVVTDPRNSIIQEEQLPDGIQDKIFGVLLTSGNAIVMMRSMMAIVDMLANKRDQHFNARIKRRLKTAILLALTPIAVNFCQTIVLNPMPNWANAGETAEFVLELFSNALSATAFGIYGAITTGIIVDKLADSYDKLRSKCSRNGHRESAPLLTGQAITEEDISGYKKFLEASKAMADALPQSITKQLVPQQLVPRIR